MSVNTHSMNPDLPFQLYFEGETRVSRDEFWEHQRRLDEAEGVLTFGLRSGFRIRRLTIGGGYIRGKGQGRTDVIRSSALPHPLQPS